MRGMLILATVEFALASTAARSQTDLATYTDANGYLDVQTLTCGQLAGTWQGDADALTS